MKSCHYGVAEEYFQSSADCVSQNVSQGYSTGLHKLTEVSNFSTVNSH